MGGMGTGMIESFGGTLPTGMSSLPSGLRFLTDDDTDYVVDASGHEIYSNNNE